MSRRLRERIAGNKKLTLLFSGCQAMIKGSICVVRVENIEDPVGKLARRLDKLVDELAKGKTMEKF